MSEHSHTPSFKTDLIVWAVLMVLTVVTIYASHLTQGTTTLAVSIAMFIATIKASTVVMYYMHLKWDHIIYKIFLAVIIALFVSFIGLLVIDYALR